MTRQLLYYFKLLLKYPKLPNLHYLRQCVKHNVLLSEVKLNGKKLVLEKSGITIDATNDDLLQVLHYINHLVAYTGATFKQTGPDLFITIKGLSFQVETKEEIFILHEVFVKGDYNYGGADPFLLIDVGMNVAITSLYYTGKENCKQIISFEPFEITYRQALKNISLNPQVSSRIKPLNYGLGSKDEKLEIVYFSSLKGAMSTVNVNNISGAKNKSIATIEVRDVVKVFNELQIENYKQQGLKIVVKMDCEGAEYGIIKALHDSGQLQLFDTLMLEWHGREPNDLKKMLMAAGLEVFLFTEFSEYGMIYAFRKAA